jgi:hypothetical protein
VQNFNKFIDRRAAREAVEPITFDEKSTVL